MYITRNLQDSLKDWRDRFYNSHRQYLNRELDSFLFNLTDKPLIKSIVVELDIRADLLNPNPLEKCVNKIRSGAAYSIFEYEKFSDDKARAVYHYVFLKAVQKCCDRIYLCNTLGLPQKPELLEQQAKVFVQRYVDPLVNYIYDQLDTGGTTLYLMLRYKQKSEWFCRESLRALYETPGQRREDVLDHNFRSFLFDQGVDYPFSSPSSPSGKADVVALLNTNDPLVLETKIFDPDIDYGKRRIGEGLGQVVKYANDYNEQIGYLLVFNMSTFEVEIVTAQDNSKFPPKILLNGKVYFIIFVNLPPLGTPPASKAGKPTKILIEERELTSVVDENISN